MKRLLFFSGFIAASIGFGSTTPIYNPVVTGTAVFNQSATSGTAVFPPSMLGTGTPTSGTVLFGDGTWRGASGTGTVTSVTAGTGLAGGTITTTGTISDANQAGVTPGTYGDATHVAVVAVNQQGRVTAVSIIPITAGGVGTVTNVATGTGLSGGPITSTGTISLGSAYAGNGIGTVNGIAQGNGSGTISAVTIGTGLLLSGGTLSSTASGGTVTSITAGTGLTGGTVTSTGTFGVATTQNITNLSNLTGNGFVVTSSGTGALGTIGIPLPVADGGTNATTVAAANQAMTPGAVSLGSLTGTVNIDWSLGNHFYGTLTGATTFTFSNAVSGQTIVIRVYQTGTNSYNVTWPTIGWTAATPPTITTAAGSTIRDTITIDYQNGVYDGSAVQNIY